MPEQMPKPASQSEWPEQSGHPFGSPDRTDEYSFILRPDAHGGIGVFAAHAINKGAALHLSNDDAAFAPRIVPESSIPGEFRKFCIDEGNGMVTRPADFAHMEMVWFLNHSPDANAAHDENYIYRALRDIAKGEEIFIDYETL